MRCLIGMDDTDSRVGQCTTHLGFRIAGALIPRGCTFRHYPRLVRLNPNIPFKTRGNAAVCLEFETDEPDEAFRVARSALLELSDVENGANAGMVFVRGAPDLQFFRRLYESAVSGVVNHRGVARLLQERRIDHYSLGNGMGLVGAAASLGFEEEADHTYELIAYRRRESLGTPRLVDAESVRTAERILFPHSFNNYEYAKRRVLITPHGPDPVFLGVRADSPEAALAAFGMLEYEEELAGHMVYLSNQCTDAHLRRRLALPLSAYSSGWVEGEVRSLEVEEGGDLRIYLDTGSSTLEAMVYSETGDLLRASRLLMTGDLVRLSGGVRRATPKHPVVVNVEKLQVMALAPRIEYANPRCQECGGATKSEGAGKGFQCRTCGAKPSTRARESRRLPRDLRVGIYLPSPGAQRHLTKPLVRYGREMLFPFRPSGAWIETELRPLREPARSRR